MIDSLYFIKDYTIYFVSSMCNIDEKIPTNDGEYARSNSFGPQMITLAGNLSSVDG
jgi:hypothetical protein